MSRLYVSADSDTIKTLRTARGNGRVSAHARGWNFGVKAQCIAVGDDIAVYVDRTSGSSEATAPRTIAEFYESAPDVYFYPVNGDTLETEDGRRYVYTVGPAGDPTLTRIEALTLARQAKA